MLLKNFLNMIFFSPNTKYASNKTQLKKALDKKDMVKFYRTLLKMKNRRPNLNIHWIMTNLYGDDYINIINNYHD